MIINELLEKEKMSRYRLSKESGVAMTTITDICSGKADLDKCAAGTGKFYEAMARAFEMPLEEFAKLSLKAKNVIPITAQCTVFAESEVTSLVGEGKPMEEIAAGLQVSIAKRCFVMAKKAGTDGKITLTGGCAKNDGLKKAIEQVLRIKVAELPIDPQLMGALGAAEFARQKGLAEQGA